MIASQKIGKSFMGALSYNMRKLNHPEERLRAELLDMNLASLDRHLIKQEVDWIRTLKPNLNKYVYHTSLNFSKEEEMGLDNDKLLAIAHDYLNGMGFTNNQYLIFRHYDADHPHMHLLVNRITFDGKVVSDSNNYKRSESILRTLEKKYGLAQVASSKLADTKAAKKDELEMVMRTGEPSKKMVLQEILSRLLDEPKLTMQEFIKRGEEMGVGFLFNQASTGRVSGVTYFYDGLAVKGQALGNRFKWSEIVKAVNYEQGRDGKAVSEGSERTRAAQKLQTAGGAEPGAGGQRPSDGRIVPIASNDERDAEYHAGPEATKRTSEGNSGGTFRTNYEIGSSDIEAAQRPVGTNQDAYLSDTYTADHEYSGSAYSNGIEINIADDIDDEAIHGRNRRRERKARTNRR
ncbi:relaxase/mobilization nuclease domain-containing protein [Mucilaginibacter terrae]|uniref:MobA/VirD2-like nuclease domain-containing protein n=1 Tax=Mucilaginibacter terrae TaxID=1955052 RepID=A0ABU3GVF2_9SPHI|nr:relaxase/mobilization nuclease domain-containing protein [Mucilaginibacter terrae]MDT3403757.1 hypothetical protein [Mucilaginibacter terrae]